MRHGSLFSGIGGFDLAAQWMGWENIFQVEWDKWCQKILAKNFPNTLRFGDIVEFNKILQNGEIITDTRLFGQAFKEKQTERIEQYCEDVTYTTSDGCREGTTIRGKVSEEIRRTESNIGNITQKTNTIRIPQIDIITGGFPCQPFSHAGKRKGTDDSRYLWPEMLTTIRILKPAFVVGENVAGLISMENGKTLDGILSDLANEGYTTEQFIIPTCGVGAWHRRDRIWIIAYSEFFWRSRIRQHDRENISGEWTTKRDIKENNVSNTVNQGLQGRNCQKLSERTIKQSIRQGNSQNNGEYWQFEPSVGRVANGIPNRVDRLKGLGNAIVPQVAYEIFKAIEQFALLE